MKYLILLRCKHNYLIFPRVEHSKPTNYNIKVFSNSYFKRIASKIVKNNPKWNIKIMILYLKELRLFSRPSSYPCHHVNLTWVQTSASGNHELLLTKIQIHLIYQKYKYTLILENILKNKQSLNQPK